MKFLPKVVKSELGLVRNLKEKLNVAKFTTKSTISSKVNVCEL